MKVVKVTAKGQITIPAEIREALGITEDSHLEVEAQDDTIRLRRVIPRRPLGDEDPIWQFVGATRAADAARDAAEQHDRYLADAEVAGWRESS